MVRRVSLRLEHEMVGILREMAVDGVIEVKTVKEFAATIAHKLGMDSNLLPQAAVQRVASEFDIAIKTQAGMSLSAAMSRIVTLEARMTTASEMLVNYAQTMVQLEKRVEELERLYVEITANVVTVTPENAAEVTRAIHQVVHPRHDKRHG